MSTESQTGSYAYLDKMTDCELAELIIMPPGTSREERQKNRQAVMGRLSSRNSLTIRHCQVIYAFDSTWGIDLLMDEFGWSPRAFKEADSWLILRCLHMGKPDFSPEVQIQGMLERYAFIPSSYARRMIDMVAGKNGFTPAAHAELLQEIWHRLLKGTKRGAEKEEQWLRRRHPDIFDFIQQTSAAT